MIYVLNDHAGETLYAVLHERPLAAPDDVCVNQVSLVEINGANIDVYDEHDNIVLSIACNDEHDARTFARSMQLIA